MDPAIPLCLQITPTARGSFSNIVSMLPEAYTKDELIRLVVDALPTRGSKCPKCRVIIPQFADLTEKDEAHLRELIRQNRKMMAMQELRSLTLCPLSWAKIWVLHSGRADAANTTAPCPFCGKALKTAFAKQCPHCNMDWHDPAHPRRLGSAEPGGAAGRSQPDGSATISKPPTAGSGGSAFHLA
jgi:hypothetical protein